MALSPSISIVSATYCVTRYPLSLRSESITASAAGKLRVGPVGRPSLRAEDDHVQGQLGHEPEGDHDLGREPEVPIRRDDRIEHLLLESEQHLQGARQHP